MHCGATLHPQLAFYAYGNAACPVDHGRYATCFNLTKDLDKLKGEEERLGQRPAMKTAAGARNPLKFAAKLQRASVEAKAKTHGANGEANASPFNASSSPRGLVSASSPSFQAGALYAADGAEAGGGAGGAVPSVVEETEGDGLEEMDRDDAHYHEGKGGGGGIDKKASYRHYQQGSEEGSWGVSEMEEVGSPGGIGGSPWEKMGGGGSMMGVHRDGWERSMSQTGAVTQSEIFHTCCMLLIDIPFTNYELLWIESEFNIPRWLTVPADIYKVLMGVLLSTMLAIEVYVILLAEKELPYNVRLLGVCGVCVVLHSTRVNTAV